jgi:hypothetical protein
VKAGGGGGGEEAGAEHLDGHPLRERAVGAVGGIDHRHAAAADLLVEEVGAEPSAGEAAERHRRRGGQQAAELAGQRPVERTILAFE